jgi:hypothetical protein
MPEAVPTLRYEAPRTEPPQVDQGTSGKGLWKDREEQHQIHGEEGEEHEADECRVPARFPKRVLDPSWPEEVEHAMSGSHSSAEGRHKHPPPGGFPAVRFPDPVQGQVEAEDGDEADRKCKRTDARQPRQIQDSDCP